MAYTPTIYKPVKSGLDYIRDREWKPVLVSRKRAAQMAEWRMAEGLRRAGFAAVVVDCGEYWRINYGKP